MVREAAQELAGRCAVVQVNTQESPGLAARYDVRGIPATLLLQGKQVLDSISGALDKASLIAWCKRHLG